MPSSRDDPVAGRPDVDARELNLTDPCANPCSGDSHESLRPFDAPEEKDNPISESTSSVQGGKVPERRSLPRLSGPKFFTGPPDSPDLSPSFTLEEEEWSSYSGLVRGFSGESTGVFEGETASGSRRLLKFSRSHTSLGPLVNAQNLSPDDPEKDPLEKYSQLQEAGAVRLKWINDSKVHCPINLSRLAFRDLLDDGWQLSQRHKSLPDMYDDPRFLPPGVPGATSFPIQEDSYQWTDIVKRHRDPNIPGYRQTVSRWVGRTAEGVIFIEFIKRGENTSCPFSSEVTKAVYEKDFRIETLNHVFVANVINKETLEFILDNFWPDCIDGIQSMEPNSPEYKAILGTRIGKVVAYLVLNAFARGTRRIARVVLWVASVYGIQLRFDIEPVGG
ncbi:uncharacterized protein N7482_000363 [Penicillium canariense]|uniref:Uncharacterized protein n=1 Tax=Penicillium canariense TaxID=189055 RepID=A0A9W9LS33_9EURO|nr:uncharacterized protein N7482_000363 [Penicillium canariense]KAJ5174486.1 hypothetical protein N7482_000363 [Penicillium canariense]